jgi:outer membrane protein TolC
MTKNRVALIICGLCWSWGLLPMTAYALTEREVLLNTLKAFPQVSIARLENEVAELEVKAADGAFDAFLRGSALATLEGYYDPRFWDAALVKPTRFFGSRVLGGYRRGFGLFPVYDQKLQTTLGGEWFVGLEFSLLRNRGIDAPRAQLQKAENGKKVGELNLKVQELDSVRLSAQRYWDWVVANERYHVQKSLLKLATDRNSALEVRVGRGDLARFDLQDNERLILQRQADLDSAERALVKAELDLSFVYRGDSGDPIVPPRNEPLDMNHLKMIEGMAESDLDSDLERVRTNHPEVNRVELLQENSRIDLEQAKNLGLPRLDFGFTGSQDVGSGSSTLTPFGLEARLSLEIPLERNLISGRIAQSQIQIDRVENQKILTQNRLSISVRDAWMGFKTAKKRYELAKKERELAEVLAKGEEKRFRMGDSNLIFLNVREQALAEVRAKEISLYAEMMRSRAEVRIFSNQLERLLAESS